MRKEISEDCQKQLALPEVESYANILQVMGQG